MAVRVRFSLLAPILSAFFKSCPMNCTSIAILRLIGFVFCNVSFSNSLKRSSRLHSLFLLIALVSSQTFGEELLLGDNEVFRFATFLYRNGEYYRAISEYKRLEYYFPNSNLNSVAKLQIGRSYLAGGQTDEAIRYWKLKLEDDDFAAEEYFRIKILLGISLLDLDREKTFSLRKKNIDAALDQLSGIDKPIFEARLINDFIDDWNTRPKPEYKSPWLAGGMSVVLPGSGSFYAGRYLEGVYAFFITSLFYLATSDAFSHEKEELGYLFGFFTLAFYGGSIYVAVNSVHKLNDKIQSDELFRLRKKHGIWFIPETNQKKGRF